jgi:DNA invertase Pin-like site-specific DNA recombinase
VLGRGGRGGVRGGGDSLNQATKQNGKKRERIMTGQRIGYRRTSTVDQNTARQLDGVPLDKVFEDKLSGKDRNRPQLRLCMEFLREGDTLIVHSLDRLGRNVRDLLDIVEDLTGRGVTVQFLHPSLSFSGDDSPINRLLFLLLAGFAEMERSLIHERQLEGIAIAKREKRYHGRVPAIRQNNGKLAEAEKLLAAGAGVAEIARSLHVSRQTVYSWLATRKHAEVAA